MAHRPVQKDYEVTRRFAADILEVSERTLDRYAKRKQITSVRRGRQLFFSEEELLSFKAKIMAEDRLKQRQEQQDRVLKGRPRAGKGTATPLQARRADDVFEDLRQAQAVEQMGQMTETDADFLLIRDELLRRSPEEGIFKKLYEETEQENKELQKKLDMAGYKVGQLENQVKNMVPVLEYKQQREELLLLADEHKQTVEDIRQLERQLNIELFAKKIYAAMLWGMLCLIPLLLILRLVAG